MEVPRGAARSVFDRAVAIAESRKRVPKQWVDRTNRVGLAGNKTFVAVLGTALLARATSTRVDPLTLKSSAKAEPGMSGYSARGVAQHVLVPCAVKYGVDLGVTSREPLNNQPFYAEYHVHREMPVRPGQVKHLDYLVETLERLRELDAADALLALAAFVRTRRTVTKRRRIEIGAAVLKLTALRQNAATFIVRNSEGGKRGQAFVAATLDMVFDDVKTSRVNDPGRHWPGDVRAMDGTRPVTSVEVKQKTVTETDVLLFGAELAEAGVERGMYAALHRSQPSLGDVEIQVRDLYGVALEVFDDAEAFFDAAVCWSAWDADAIAREFPERMLRRLEEMEASTKGQAEWARLFAG